VSINPDTFQSAIDALSTVLKENPNPAVRAKAAKSLGQLRSAEALITLCERLSQEQASDVQIVIMEAIVELYLSQQAQPMSESPKYDLRGANIGNFAETIQTGSRQEATQYINATEQDFDRLLADYKNFLAEIQQKYPAQTPESAVQPIIDAEFQELQNTQPQRWQNFLSLKRLWNGGKKATLKIGEHFTEDSLWGKAAVAFLEGILEDPEA
jgi:HEAT repeat protein